jgi:polar amino acid transport system substrate-binding protein
MPKIAPRRSASGPGDEGAPAIVIPLVAAASILILSGWATISVIGTPVPDALARAKRGEPLRIGYAVEAPYAFVARGGAVSGESPSIAAFVAGRLGVTKVEWRRLEFGSLIDALEADRIDLIAAGMFITPQRESRVLFSAPTFRARQGLLVRSGNPKGLRSYAQAASSPDARVAVLSGSVEETILLSQGIDERRLIRVPDAGTGFAALASGMADGLALSAPTVRWMASRDGSGSTEAARPMEQSAGYSGGYGAFGFRKADYRLRDAWNRVLESFVGGEEHLALVGPFGFSREDLPAEAPGVRPGAGR